jgi:hypothetical protein
MPPRFFFANVAKRVRKAPKLYLRDTGPLHALMGMDFVPNFLSKPPPAFDPQKRLL